jgi:hypothetical protein
VYDSYFSEKQILYNNLFVLLDMNTDTSKGNNDAATGSVTNVGDTSRDITDTGDVARASIAKGRGGGQGTKTATTATTAADIAKGQIDADKSIIQGTTTAATQKNTATEDDNTPAEEVVSSGTSLNEDRSIDKADIYSTEETGTRHLEKAQRKPVEKVEDKEKGSWRIKEERKEN